MNLDRFTVVIFCDAEAWVSTNLGANSASDLIDRLRAEELPDGTGIELKDILIQSEINKLEAKLEALKKQKKPILRGS